MSFFKNTKHAQLANSLALAGEEAYFDGDEEGDNSNSDIGASYVQNNELSFLLFLENKTNKKVLKALPELPMLSIMSKRIHLQLTR
jgi:hypothetical protein